MATCTQCQRQQTRGEVFFVKPTPSRAPGAVQTREEKQQIDFNQPEPGKTALEAIEQPLCKRCYLEAFARIYPGARLPHLPDPPEADAPVVQPQAPQGTPTLF